MLAPAVFLELSRPSSPRSWPTAVFDMAWVSPRLGQSRHTGQTPWTPAVQPRRRPETSRHAASASPQVRWRDPASVPSCEALREEVTYWRGASDDASRRVDQLSSQTDERTREVRALGEQLEQVTRERDALLVQQHKWRHKQSELMTTARALADQLASERSRCNALMEHIREQHALLNAQQRLVRAERAKSTAGAGSACFAGEAETPPEHRTAAPAPAPAKPPPRELAGGTGDAAGSRELWEALTKLYAAPHCCT